MQGVRGDVANALPVCFTNGELREERKASSQRLILTPVQQASHCALYKGIGEKTGRNNLVSFVAPHYGLTIPYIFIRGIQLRASAARGEGAGVSQQLGQLGEQSLTSTVGELHQR